MNEGAPSGSALHVKSDPTLVLFQSYRTAGRLRCCCRIARGYLHMHSGITKPVPSVPDIRVRNALFADFNGITDRHVRIGEQEADDLAVHIGLRAGITQSSGRIHANCAIGGDE